SMRSIAMNALRIAGYRPRSSVEPYAEVVEITPQLAEEWLGRNSANRNLRSPKVATYAGAIERGEWVVTGDGPKFDVNERLINGQHTLNAVIRSGRPVTSFVFWNLPVNAQVVMDTGAKRSAADALK